ncbi:MAG: hypothetical protein LBH45_01840 [Campylobacteraceae bacterium]|jgi:hypothetical protein|nr:hypothetical protein [Campylobacteraceae bacterium]
MTKIRLLSAFGLSEKASVIAIFVVLLALMGIGMTADLIAGEDRQWIGLIFLFTSFGIYLFFNYKSRNLSFNPSPVDTNKKYFISIIPSNINLLNSIKSSYENLKKVYFIYDDFSNEKINEVKREIEKNKQFYSAAKYLKVKSTNEPKNIISSFDDIMQELEDVEKSDILIDITSGQTLSSLTLYNLGKLYNISVSCLISKYDNNNKVLANSTFAYLIKFDTFSAK